MGQNIGNVFKSIVQFWKSLTKKIKIIILSVLGGVVLLAIILALVLREEKYVALYTGVETSEESEIIQQLDNMGVDAKVDDGGTILVEESKADKARMQLAVLGYPKSTFSYTNWTDSVNMFTTDTDKKEIARRDLQERLQATINTIAGVDEAYVTLDIPQTTNTVLSSGAKVPSASITLHLKGGITLTSSQIKGITHIVMMSVSGLTEENIAIVDGTGRLLTSNDDTVDQISLETQKLQFKKDFEDAIRMEILDLLIPSYGENGVKVAISADIDYDKKVTENTQYTPSVGDNGMVQQEEHYEANGTNGSPDDVVGVTPNADGTYPTGDGGTYETWSESKQSTSYLVNTLKEQTEKQGYYVNYVNVSVMIYKANVSQSEKNTIVNTAVKAAGTTSERVSVENLPLLEDKPDETQPVQSDIFLLGLTLDQLIFIAIAGIILLLIILIIISLIIRKIKRKKKVNEKAQISEEEALRLQQEKEAAAVKHLGVDETSTKEKVIRHEIENFAQNSPDVAAQLLKSWLREEDEK